MTGYQYQKSSLRKKKSRGNSSFLELPTRVGLLAFLVVMSVLYVFQATKSSTSGFEMTDLERQVTALQHENRRLEVEIAQYRSLHSIQERLADSSFVAAGDIQYLARTDRAVARR